MRHSRGHPLFTGIVAAVVLLVLMTAVVVTGIPGGPQISLPWNQLTMLHVQLADSQELAPHASVEVGGVKIGEVQSVTAQGNLSVANLQIQPRYAEIHSDATVYLRAHGLFGPKYIFVVPGTSSSPLLADGGTITVGHTVQPVNLDNILQALQAPEQVDLRTTLVQLGEAAAGRGNDVNHLFAAANSLTQVLDSPLKAIDGVAPQLSDMLVKNEAFNSYFAQTPLDQLVANSEQTFQAFAANASHLQSVLTHADSSLTTLDAALNGQPGNLTSIIQQLGSPGGTVDKLDKLTYLLALFGANVTGKEASLGSDPAAQNVTSGIIGAITNIASAFNYSDPCPAVPVTPGYDNHCSLSPDGRQHYLQVRLFNFPPSGNPNPQVRVAAVGSPAAYSGGQMSSFAALLGS